jgi:hypothetical protein
MSAVAEGLIAGCNTDGWVQRGAACVCAGGGGYFESSGEIGETVAWFEHGGARRNRQTEGRGGTLPLTTTAQLSSSIPSPPEV